MISDFTADTVLLNGHKKDKTMQIRIQVPAGTDVKKIPVAHSDLIQDSQNDINGNDVYFVSVGDDDDYRDKTHDEAAQLCGEIEAACPDADTLIDGYGAWAQADMRKREAYKRHSDFVVLVLSENERDEK